MPKKPRPQSSETAAPPASEKLIREFQAAVRRARARAAQVAPAAEIPDKERERSH